jgi:lysophospholipase L1-like esterase
VRFRRPGTDSRRNLVVVALVVALALIGVAAVSISSRSGGSKGEYLALGDSLAFGYQPGGEYPPPNYHDVNSFVGYPELVGRSLDLDVVNASCPGETVNSMISVKGLSYGCENTDGKGTGYRTTFPLHTTYTGSQLAFAVKYLEAHRDVKLVTLDIGLNDVSVCETLTSDNCASSKEQFSLRAEITNGLTTIYHDIRIEAGYTGPIVSVSYYGSGTAASEAVAKTLNGVTEAVAGAYNVRVADGYDTFQRDSAVSGGNPCSAGLIIALPNGTCDLHPTRRGQTDLAAAVVQALKE